VSQVSHHVIQDRSRSWGDPGRTKNPSVLLQPNYAKLRILDDFDAVHLVSAQVSAVVSAVSQ